MKKQRGALNKISKLLRIAVPQFSKLEIERERKTGTPHLMAKFEHWRAKGPRRDEPHGRVEGDTDIPVVRALARSVGLELAGDPLAERWARRVAGTPSGGG